jgi:hypothetical protein
VVAQSTGDGIDINPPFSGGVEGVVNRTTMDGNTGNGLLLGAISGGGTMNVVDSVASNNATAPSTAGFNVFAQGGTLLLTLRNVTAANNGTGILGDAIASGAVTIRIAHSLISGNGTGVAQNDFATVASYGDNDINGNTTTDVSGILSPVNPR